LGRTVAAARSREAFPLVLAGNTAVCWRALRETVPGFAVVDERHVVLVGTRDLEPYQRDRLQGSDVRVVPGAIAADQLDEALHALRAQIGHVYLHVDLDVLDTAVGRANPYAAAGCPNLDGVLTAIDATFARFSVVAAALTAYDPRVDESGAIASAAPSIAGRIAAHAAAQR
jgi:arginase